MAQLALQAVGYVVGSYFGYPQLGALVGTLAGAAIAANQTQRVQGPKIDDLRVTGLEYGDPIPYAKGHPVLAGQIWWASDRRPIATTTSQGGKGGPTTESTTYTYEVDLLVGLTSNQIAGVTRIWANGKLVYNVRSDATAATALASSTNGAWRRMTVYTGASTQLPDPTYEAAVGVGNAPAYRGRGSVFIEGLNLGGSGAVPNLTFEISTAGTGGARFANGTYPDDILWRSVIHTPELGGMYVAVGNSATSIFSRDGVTWQPGAMPANKDWFALTFGEDRFVALSSTGELADSNDGQTWNNLGVPFVSGAWTAAAFNGNNKFVAVGQGTPKIASSTNGVIWQSETAPSADLWRGIVWGGGQFVAVGDAGAIMTSPDGQTWTLRSAPISPDWEGVAWNGSLYVAVANSGIGRIASSPDGITWTQRTAPGGSSQGLKAVAWNGRRFAAVGTGNEVHVSADGITWTAANVTGFASINYGSIASNGFDFAGVAFTGTGNRVFAGFDSFTLANEGLAATVSALCQRAGMSTGLFDVTALASITKPVRGFCISDLATTRQVLELLQSTYFFDSVLSDKLYFRPRGGSSVDTIPFIDLGASEKPEGDDEPLVINPANDLEVPSGWAITYMNADADCSKDTQPSDRQMTTSRTIDAREVPLLFTPAEAKAIADAWRDDAVIAAMGSTRISLPISHAAKEPTDVVTVVAEDGSTFRMRLLRLTETPGAMAFEAVLDDASALTQAGITSTDYESVVTVDSLGVSETELMDIAILRDADNDPGYYAAAKGSSSPHPGTGMFTSPDDVTYSSVVNITEQATFGRCSTTLGDWTGGNVVDTAHTVTVNVGNGTLSSTTYAGMLDDNANACLIGDEILQFQTASLLSAGVYLLSGLLRGRRGTEWAQTGHAANERFVLLSTQGLRRMPVLVNEIGALRYVKGVTLGRALSTAFARQITPAAVGLKPFSPVNLRITRQPNNSAALLAHFNGTNGSTGPFPETGSASSPATLTSVNGAALSTTNVVLGSASLLLNGSNQRVTTNRVCNIGTGQFTISFRVRPRTAQASTILCTDNGRLVCAVNSAGAPSISGQDGLGNNLSLAGANGLVAMNDSASYHMALTRNASNRVDVWINGVSVANTTHAFAIGNGTSNYHIGSNIFGGASSFLDGYIDELHVVEGTCLYTSTFTPETAEFGDATSNDGAIALAWDRRTRLAYSFDAPTLPLGEDEELYDVEIGTDGTFATIARTFSNVTQESQAYTAAQQIADFGNVQGAINVRVFQLSATVGRGYEVEGIGI